MEIKNQGEKKLPKFACLMFRSIRQDALILPKKIAFRTRRDDFMGFIGDPSELLVRNTKPRPSELGRFQSDVESNTAYVLIEDGDFDRVAGDRAGLLGLADQARSSPRQL
jgi:hypothetical protein